MAAEILHLPGDLEFARAHNAATAEQQEPPMSSQAMASHLYEIANGDTAADYIGQATIMGKIAMQILKDAELGKSYDFPAAPAPGQPHRINDPDVIHRVHIADATLGRGEPKRVSLLFSQRRAPKGDIEYGEVVTLPQSNAAAYHIATGNNPENNEPTPNPQPSPLALLVMEPTGYRHFATDQDPETNGHAVYVDRLKTCAYMLLRVVAFNEAHGNSEGTMQNEQRAA